MISVKIVLIGIYVFALICVWAGDASAYLDPGTGSYVFQLLIASLVGGLFAIKIFWGRIAGFFKNHFPGNKKNG